MGKNEYLTEAMAGAVRQRLRRMVRADGRSCRCGKASNCAKRSHHPSLARPAVRCGIGAVVCTCALMGGDTSRVPRCANGPARARAVRIGQHLR